MLNSTNLKKVYRVNIILLAMADLWILLSDVDEELM